MVKEDKATLCPQHAAYKQARQIQQAKLASLPLLSAAPSLSLIHIPQTSNHTIISHLMQDTWHMQGAGSIIRGFNEQASQQKTFQVYTGKSTAQLLLVPAPNTNAQTKWVEIQTHAVWDKNISSIITPTEQ